MRIMAKCLHLPSTNKNAFFIENGQKSFSISINKNNNNNNDNNNTTRLSSSCIFSNQQSFSFSTTLRRSNSRQTPNILKQSISIFNYSNSSNAIHSNIFSNSKQLFSTDTTNQQQQQQATVEVTDACIQV